MGIYYFEDYEREPGENTIAYYPLEEDGNDYSGNNKHLTNIGFSFSDNVAILNGSQKATMPDISSYKTICFRAYTESSSQQGVVLSGNRSSGEYNYIFQIFNTKCSGGSTGGGTFNSDFAYDTSINYGEWHLFGISQSNYNYSSGDYVKFYKDGECFYTLSNHTFNKVLNSLGYIIYDNAYYFKGKLSNLIFEDKQRTDQEWLDYNNGTKSLYGIS